MKKRETLQMSRLDSRIGGAKQLFRQKVLAIVRRIPKGGCMTYTQVATQAGNSKAARGVGAIMRSNYDPTVPCHRVVRSDGSLGNYNRGGQRVKKMLLTREGAL